MIEGKHVTIWTDGSATVRGERLGGLGIYSVNEDEKEWCFKRGYTNTTIDRMEVRAVLLALLNLSPEVKRVIMYIDRKNVADTLIENKLVRWSGQQWLGVANSDLWAKIYEQLLKMNERKVRIKVVHINSHTKDFDNPIVLGNYYADQLANFKEQEYYYNDSRIEEK